MHFWSAECISNRSIWNSLGSFGCGFEATEKTPCSDSGLATLVRLFAYTCLCHPRCTGFLSWTLRFVRCPLKGRIAEKSASCIRCTVYPTGTLLLILLGRIDQTIRQKCTSAKYQKCLVCMTNKFSSHPWTDQ